MLIGGTLDVFQPRQSGIQRLRLPGERSALPQTGADDDQFHRVHGFDRPATRKPATEALRRRPRQGSRVQYAHR